ncbi:Wzz/FepE/Etk N-terminal domain-containing protein [Sphingomonas sp. TDK1]|uniref:Wzz/FepE/Etk N-terminal domain-containing protein n=1 Tax=Sphingomonas sp. TDK1 TaxID=453247 RepID=UPI0007D95482|nr:Wzz/FepE/Etk N-terminal domain-containing protein [Sphingomonas sp. TDK1]OAN66851.1 exopolysaccharide biosynthesis protein EpsF [Sphingomonas sp. TDK1]
MNIVQFFRILWARRWIIIPAFLVCVATATIVVQFLPERYLATTRVALNTFKPDPVTGQVMSSQFMRAYVQTQTELIEDYAVAGRVVDELGWANDPANIAAFNASSAAGTGDIRRWLAKQIIANTKAGMIEGSNILEITYTDSSAERAERIANIIRTNFLALALASKRQSATKSADWYAQQAEAARQALASAVQARTDYVKKSGIVLTDTGSDLDTQRLAQLEGASALAVAPQMSTAGAMGPAQLQLAQLDQQIQQAATSLGPNHPAFQALQRQREVYAKAAAQERVQLSGGGGGGRGAIESATSAARARVIGNREEVDRLTQLQRDVSLKQDQYMKAAQRVADLRLEASSDDTGMSTLSEATAPESPYYPKVPLIIGGAAGLGLGLGLLVALLVELLARRVRSPEDLEVAVDAPVLGVVQSRASLSARLRRAYEHAGESADSHGAAVN